MRHEKDHDCYTPARSVRDLFLRPYDAPEYRLLRRGMPQHLLQVRPTEHSRALLYIPTSSEELIYHLPGGQHYDVTNPEVCFASKADAENSGVRSVREVKR